MVCPQCHAAMHEVNIESHYATPIILDQCPKCGGLWFEGTELFRARGGEAQKVEAVDADKLCTPAPLAEKPLCCPRDHTTLTPFSDPNFPKEIIVESCSMCGGFWLNHCEFIEFQERRRKAVATPAPKAKDDERLLDDIEKLLLRHNKNNANDVLGKLGTFLSRPVDRETLRPWKPLGRGENAVDVIITIVTTILSLLLRR